MSIPRICTALAIAVLFFFSAAFADGVVFSPKTTSRRKSAKIEAVSSNYTPPSVVTVKSLLPSMKSLLQVSRRQNLICSHWKGGLR
nr:hypothetical protein Itr_chr14CG08130 [Ipomoea trifida]